jgi:hypothetical protein
LPRSPAPLGRPGPARPPLDRSSPPEEGEMSVEETWSKEAREEIEEDDEKSEDILGLG